MLKSLKIDNFKSLVDFTIDFHECNVIIGNNATGKSTILQAIDFLCSSVKEDFGIILERRGWKVENIKSKLTSSKMNRISFVSKYSLEVAGDSKQFVWELVISTNKSKNELLLQSESVTVDGKEILVYQQGKDGFFNQDTQNLVSVIPGAMSLSSSVMKIVRGSNAISRDLQALIMFLENSSSFELLSPSEMRLSSRGNKETIGISGKNLPSFIKRMDEAQLSSFMRKLDKVLGGRVEKVAAVTKGKPGWTEITTNEKFKNHILNVTSKEMSDGMLRLLAFIAISEIQTPEAIMLLDEVENGINIDYAESLMQIMQQLYKEKRHQLLMTTHSTVFIDYIDAQDIIFLYRDDDGRTKAVHLFEKDYFKEKLGYMWPGEVILNMSQRELVEKVLMIQEDEVCL